MKIESSKSYQINVESSKQQALALVIEVLYRCALTGFSALLNAAAKFRFYFNWLFTGQFDFKPGGPGTWICTRASGCRFPAGDDRDGPGLWLFELQARSRLGTVPWPLVLVRVCCSGASDWDWSCSGASDWDWSGLPEKVLYNMLYNMLNRKQIKSSS